MIDKKLVLSLTRLSFPLVRFRHNLECVRAVLKKTVVGDWRFAHLSGSQVKSRRQIMVFMPLVVVMIGQFCRDVIGRQDLKVAAIGRLWFYCY